MQPGLRACKAYALPLEGSSRNTLSLPPQGWDCKHALLYLGILTGVWGLNSGPHTYTAGTVTGHATSPALRQLLIVGTGIASGQKDTERTGKSQGKNSQDICLDGSPAGS